MECKILNHIAIEPLKSEINGGRRVRPFVCILVMAVIWMARIIGPGIMGGMFGNEKDIKSNKSGKSEKSEKGKKRDGITEKKELFLEAMEEAENNLNREEMEEAFRELEIMGRDLVRNPNFKRLEDYKKSVSQFLKMVLRKMYKIENKEGLPRIGHAQKVYINITKIDEQLEELTNKFMKQQNEPMNVIKEIEGIQGLIYNIIV